MQIGMLGPFEIRTSGGDPVDVPGARLRALLAALALRPGQVVPKASLVDWIWGERPPADAANALQRLVSRLRKALPDGVVEGRADGYRLAVEPDAVDAVRFERLVTASRTGPGERTGPTVQADPAVQADPDADTRRARLLREALGLWRGAAFQDVALRDSAAFDAAAARLEELRLAATEDRFDAEIACGQGARAVTELTDLAAAHPLRERFTAALMRALVAAGRDSEALLAYERTREALADALGADPSPELSALHVALLRGETGRRAEVPKTNLRAELTTFVGRDADVAALRELVAGHRLTTVTGPGGSGKTRLAAEAARTLLGELPDGVWLAEFAALGADGDVAGVAHSALAGLGLRDALLGGAPHAEPADRLVAAIRDREALLILDNCEHVIESAAVLAHRLLGECRRLRILATSREPLGITGEALWPVEPLPLPAADAGPDEIASSPAVRLLRDRAGAVRRDLAADDRTLATMVRVCRALDGMPLAIELAAARLRTLSVDQLAHRLDDRFRLLTGGSRTALPRHRTLRAVVDWSWELLTDAERKVLRRLAVFSGGASLEAAEHVCADGTDETHGTDEAVGRDRVLDLLTALTEKSLLVAEDGESTAAPRYRMLGTIREYAGQRLAEAGEAERARRAHLAYFTELAETADPHLRRAEQLDWLAALEAEHDEIGAAMRGALAAGEGPAAMRLAAGAGWYWWLSGHKSEGNELVTAAAAAPGEAADEVRAMVYGLVVLFVSGGQGDEHHAAHWIHEAYRLGRHARDRYPLLRLISPLERLLRTPEAAPTAFEPLLDDEDPWVRALGRWHLGKMRVMLGVGGRDADAYLEGAVAEFRALGERYGISIALTELAERTAVRGGFAVACEHYEQAIAAVTEAGAVEDVIRMRSRQARLYRLLGDEAACSAALAEAERRAERVTWPDALVDLALAKAELARWAGDTEEAHRQLGVATTLWGDEAAQANIRAGRHDLLGYLADDLDASRAHRAAACEAAAEAGHAPLIAQVLVGVADLALRRGEPAQAVRLLAASTRARGLQDHSHPDAARIERAARRSLGDAGYAEAAREGAGSDWARLAEITLA
ncbi:BTAD domain-containing putative transcriptional regulator [Streptomyces huiliensis]|uniref:BTAD domain-containing putative transcriptional regulator n=1 Tax=Streptomyces huiliensis TaxID=2876027 RepID=UPI001CBEA149|nr:BTAD domain-containing putative transcriptional regulator [Streptomyces huiliensis]MBZ4323733.1 winged helix-turn-helix domain-containing protein [Streptomyces huiliensis]